MISGKAEIVLSFPAQICPALFLSGMGDGPGLLQAGAKDPLIISYFFFTG